MRHLALNIISYPLKKNRCYQQNVKRRPIGIQIHSIGTAQGTAKAVADYWNSPNVEALVHYIVDCDDPGKVLYTLPEDVYAWADGGYGNRNLITIEICESDYMKYISGASYSVTDPTRFQEDILRGYDTAVLLCADICRRYNWDPMAKLPSGLFLISSHDEGRQAGLSTAHVDPTHIWSSLGLSMTTFRQAVKNAISGAAPSEAKPAYYYRVRKSWTDVSSQLGAFTVLTNARAACPPGYSVFDEDGKAVYSNSAEPSGTQASEFLGLSETEAAKKILELVHKTDTSGILNSVTAAQMILESGYGKTDLAQAANNCFGMKSTLSGNTWETVWDGQSVVSMPTWEYYNGHAMSTYADFRKYPCVEDSVIDHAYYLLGAKNGSKKRYEGLIDARSYSEAIGIIKDGGYATDPDYVRKICAIIQRFGLDAYDPDMKPSAPAGTIYRVQVGSYKLKTGAYKKADAVKKETGFDTAIITGEDGSYKVICGSFTVPANAATRLQKLKKLKIDAFISTS